AGAGQQEIAGGAVPPPRLRCTGQLAIPGGLDEVTGEVEERPAAAEGAIDLLAGPGSLEAADVRVHEDRREGLEDRRAPERLRLLEGEPHRRVVEHAAVHEAPHADLQGPSTLGGGMRLTGQAGERGALRPGT